MSYILDALRKSERDRKKGEVPDLNTVQTDPSSLLHSSRRLWPYLLSGVLVLGTIFLVPWLILRQPEVAETTQSPSISTNNIIPPGTSAGHEPPSAKPTPDRRFPDKKPVAAPDQASVNLSSGAPDAASLAEPASELPQVTPEIAVIFESVPEPDQEEYGQDFIDESPETTDEDTEQQQSGVIPFENLPAVVAGELPDLNISAHYFANNSRARMVSINGRMMRQGQKIDNNLVLEEITRTGVIISSGKYRFNIEVFTR